MTTPSTEVVVTGLGVISPAGRGVESAWNGVLAGKAAAAQDELLVDEDCPVTISCRVPAFDPAEELGRRAARRLDRFTQLALLAATEATDTAGLDDDGGDGGIDWDRVGVLLGSGIGGAESWAEEYPRYLEKGPRRVSPLFIPKMLSNTAAGVIAIETGARGPNMTVNTACAAGASAIHLGREMIRSGAADIVLAGGVEAGITGLAVSAFAQMGALSSNPDPEAASRPFDADRDGFVMGEGAGVVVIESREHAAARGARALAVVAGCGASADAHHTTAPPEDGAGAVLAMQRALQDAGLPPEVVGHINAHGTSTPLNDISEARAVRTVFGDLQPVVSSTKGVTGHQLGAAGAVEAAFAVLALNQNVVPPTANLTNQDADIDLDVASGEPRSLELEAVLSNAFGFGGQNASLLFTAVEDEESASR